MRFVGLDFRVLGPLEVICDGRPLALGGARRRALLALLVLEAGELVTTERIVEEVWQGGRGDASRSVQVYASQLRQLLGDGERIRGETGGYRLLASPEEIDARRFERLLEEGRRLRLSGEHGPAAETLRKALALWRGAPLADLAYAPVAQVESARLEELRLGATEELIEAELALGRHREVLSEIEALVAAEPLRERPRRQLMLALYRCGRQAHALSAYQDARRTLVEELGLEPGPELRELEAAILRQERTLLVEPAELRARRRLPAAPSDLVGRRREVTDVVALLRDGSRLVTLTGPGGTGKTRIALQAAHELAERFEDGVWWVGLAALTDPELVESTIAHAVEAKNGLAEHLRPRHALLLLDNFEQVADAAATVADLMRDAPGVKVLVTSRAPLHVSGEWEYPVDPLPDADAVALFCERARAVNPTFVSDEHVAEICRRLDGLPLALELAAARSRLLAPAQLLGRLQQGLPLLTGGARDAPERQRTLRSTIDWSYELLAPSEKTLLARLSIFAGGWTLEAAEAVCEAAVDELASLRDSSLIGRRDERFFLLDTIREYAFERLVELGEHAETEARHARYYAALASDLRPQFRSTQQRAAIATLVPEQHNLRGALEWSSAHAPGLLLELAGNLGGFWAVTGALEEGRRWLELALAVPSPSKRDRSSVLMAAASLAMRSGDPVSLKRYATEAVELARSRGDAKAEASALVALAMGFTLTHEGTRARALYDDAVTAARRAGDDWGLATALGSLGYLVLQEGAHEEAVRISAESVALQRSLGNRMGMATGLCNIGLAAFREGRLAEARDAFLESLDVSVELGFDELIVCSLVGCAALASQEGRTEAARKLLVGADALAGEHGLVLQPVERRLRDETSAALGEHPDESGVNGDAPSLDELLSLVRSSSP
jgi:predicted ATPase/DNA-binding SARP family transcriptional activator